MRIELLVFIVVVLSAVSLKTAAAGVTATDQGFGLVIKDHVAQIVIDAEDHRVVAIAATCLQDDIERVSGRKPAILHEMPQGPAVLIGSLERGRLIRSLVETGKLDISDLKDQWECFKIVQSGDNLVVVGSDRRGAAYGALELSRAIGVSPWYWWADVPPQRRETIHISTDGARVGPPSVKYRGIFLNDEDWGLQPWAAKTFEPEIGNIGPRTYARMFELLLRLKANYCWPAMHRCSGAFNANPRNKQVADDYAIVMGSSHCEQMLRNNISEWPHEKVKEYDPVTNLSAVCEYWERRVVENGKFENTWTVGMRGIHDSGMPGAGTLDEKRVLLEKIIALQRDMLARHVNRNVAAVPQIFCPYKEVLDIYRTGMSLPDDITIVWPDDNFGYIRQLPDDRERKRAGRSGIYYHLSYNGRPHDYLWLESIPPALIWHEMTKAHELGADRLWVVNVGDLKPIEAGITLFLELAWKIDRYGADVSRAFLRDFYAEQFGAQHADSIADIKREYFRLCAIRKPETLGWNNTYKDTPVQDGEFSHEAANDEAMRFVEQWLSLARRADALAAQLAPEQRPAYFQLVQYPASAAAAMAEKMVLAERSRLLAARGDPSANRFADRAQSAIKRIEQLTQQYNEQLEGKWRHIMDHRPRKLPVFDEPVVGRVESPTTAGAATSPALRQRAPTVAVDVAHPARLRGGQARWIVVEGLGRRGVALAMLPRLTNVDDPARAPRAEYEVQVVGNADPFEVVIEALPTQPLTPQHKLLCGISFDDEPPTTVSFDQSSEERDPVWQQNVLGNAMLGSVKMPLHPGRHVLRLWGLDPSVSVQHIELRSISK